MATVVQRRCRCPAGTSRVARDQASPPPPVSSARDHTTVRGHLDYVRIFTDTFRLYSLAFWALLAWFFIFFLPLLFLCSLGFFVADKLKEVSQFVGVVFVIFGFLITYLLFCLLLFMLWQVGLRIARKHTWSFGDFLGVLGQAHWALLYALAWLVYHILWAIAGLILIAGPSLLYGKPRTPAMLIGIILEVITIAILVALVAAYLWLFFRLWYLSPLYILNGRILMDAFAANWQATAEDKWGEWTSIFAIQFVLLPGLVGLPLALMLRLVCYARMIEQRRTTVED